MTLHKPLLLAFGLVLAGCAEQRAAPPGPIDPPARASQPPARAANPNLSPNLSGFSPEFKAGYADGCASVGTALKRDASRFVADGSYARGWRDGYSSCKK